MKFRPLLIVGLFLVLPGVVSGHICSGAEACNTGETPDAGFCISVQCPIKCAAECGKLTHCHSLDRTQCRTCCSGEKCAGYGSLELSACIESCTNTCLVNGDFCSMLDILRMLALGAGIILFSINGIRWMIAEDDQGRVEARRGILWVLFGLIVIAVATSLVNYIMIGDLVC